MGSACRARHLRAGSGAHARAVRGQPCRLLQGAGHRVRQHRRAGVRSGRLDARRSWRSACRSQRLDLGDAKWNAATLARNLLDGERYPEARFVSTRDRAASTRPTPRSAASCTLRGVTRRCAWTSRSTRSSAIRCRRSAAPPAFPPPPRSAAATSASMRWPTVIGDAVELRIEAEAVRTIAPTHGDAGGCRRRRPMRRPNPTGRARPTAETPPRHSRSEDPTTP